MVRWGYVRLARWDGWEVHELGPRNRLKRSLEGLTRGNNLTLRLASFGTGTNAYCTRLFPPEKSRTDQAPSRNRSAALARCPPSDPIAFSCSCAILDGSCAILDGSCAIRDLPQL